MLVGTRRWSRQAAKDSQSSREGTYRDGKFDVVYCMVSDLYHTYHINHISSYMIWFNCPNLSRHSRTSGRATGQMQVICGRRNFVHASAVPKLRRCDFERFAEVCRLKSIHRYIQVYSWVYSCHHSTFEGWHVFHGLRRLPEMVLASSCVGVHCIFWVMVEFSPRHDIQQFSQIEFSHTSRFERCTICKVQSDGWHKAAAASTLLKACLVDPTMIKTGRCGCLHPCLAVEPHQAKAEFDKFKDSFYSLCNTMAQPFSTVGWRLRVTATWVADELKDTAQRCEKHQRETSWGSRTEIQFYSKCINQYFSITVSTGA